MVSLALIKKNLEESIKIKKDLLKYASSIDGIAKAMIEALKKGGKVIVFGNGGSASDSQHMVAELVGRFNKEKRPLAAIALTANTTLLTAIGNDYGYEHSFSKQLEANGKKGDIAFAISTSGNAKNVLAAVLVAKRMGIKTVGLSGKDGGRLLRICDIPLVVPSNSTARIQEAHITIIHILCELIEEAFV
jgi:D-sedoheptulose 7-phosphate isomerase